MNYIYDIYLNFNKILYDFFEWNKTDKIYHIKKIPIIKIDTNSFKDIVSNKINIDNNLLKNISNKTEVWNSDKGIPFSVLISDSDNIIAILFDSKGNSIQKSSLQPDDELEALELTKKLKEHTINYRIICKEKSTNKTRKQIDKERFVNNELKNITKERLYYIYYECFEKKEKNKNIILKRISVLDKNSITYEKLYNILKLTTTCKK